MTGALITLAGRISVRSDGTVLDERALPGRQPRVAFSLLLLERDRPVARDELAASLWDEDRPATWEPALRGVVSRVRSFVVASGLGGAATLSSDAGTYRLHPVGDVEVDLEVAARQLGRAEAALRRGDAAAAVADAAPPSEATAGDHVVGVTFHGGGWVAVVATDAGAVELWRETELRPAHRLLGHRERVTKASFGAEQIVTTSTAEGVARVWDLDDGAPVVAVTDHGGPLGHAAIDPTATEVATVGEDGVVRLWSMPSGDERIALYGHRLIATSAAYSSDGRLLATTSPDGTVALRLRTVDELLDLARSRVTRALDDAECRRFLSRACALEQVG